MRNPKQGGHSLEVFLSCDEGTVTSCGWDGASWGADRRRVSSRIQSVSVLNASVLKPPRHPKAESGATVCTLHEGLQHSLAMAAHKSNNLGRDVWAASGSAARGNVGRCDSLYSLFFFFFSKWGIQMGFLITKLISANVMNHSVNVQRTGLVGPQLEIGWRSLTRQAGRDGGRGLLIAFKMVWELTSLRSLDNQWNQQY